MKTNLLSPFREAFEHNDAIQYKSSGQDHEYVKKLGYEVHAGGDCTCFVKELDGLVLSGYSDNGEFFPRLANENSRKVFLAMVSNGAVKLYGFTAYIKENGILRTYSYQDGVCKKFSDEGKWVECEVPYSNRRIRNAV